MAQYFCGNSVVNVSAIVEDAEIAESLEFWAKVRNETMNRCLNIPSYSGKSLAWKNRYYDVIAETSASNGGNGAAVWENSA